MVWRVVLTNIIFLEVISVDGDRGTGDSKIVGGYFVRDITIMPWIIDILNTSHNVGHICGGSLLTPIFVLTACHCLSPVSADEFEPSIPEDIRPYLFIAGSLQSGARRDAYGQVRRAKDFLIHPQCREIDDIMRYDYGIAVMARPFVENAFVKRINIISLNGKEFKNRTYAMLRKSTTFCHVAGWGEVRRGNLGDFDRGVMSKKLKMIRMYVISEDKCQRLFGRLDDRFLSWDFKRHEQICALGRKNWGSDCQGDSGGPFVCSGFQVGLVSYGLECGISTPAIYAGLGLFLEWFNNDVLAQYVNRKAVKARRADAVSRGSTPHPVVYITICILLELRKKQLTETS